MQFCILNTDVIQTIISNAQICVRKKGFKKLILLLYHTLYLLKMFIYPRISTRLIFLSFFDEEDKARHSLYISNKNNNLTSNLLYWNEKYAYLTNVKKLFSYICKQRAKASLPYAVSKT